LRATISQSSPTTEVQIKFGPKAGILTGLVTNAETGAPLGAVFKLTQAGNPKVWFSAGEPPSYRVLLPPSTRVLIEVSAPGYKTWESLSPLILAAGSETRLNISLQPTHDPALLSSEFVVPEAYVGWILLEYGVKDAVSVPIEGNTRVFKFPQDGILITSSSGPEPRGEKRYLYYSEDGTTTEVPNDYRHGNRRVWGEYEGFSGGVLNQFGFFVGTEDQYKLHPHSPGISRNK
jgi:hypothetical protein